MSLLRTDFRKHGVALRTGLLALIATCALALAPRGAAAAPPPPTSAVASASASGADKAPPPTTIEDPRYDLHLTFASEDADVCVVFPEGRADPEACDGVDLAASRKVIATQGDKPIATALLRFSGWAIVAAVIQLPDYTGTWTKSDMDGFVRGLGEGLPRNFPGATLHGSAPGSAYDPVDLHGHAAVRYFLDAPVAQSDPRWDTSRQVGYGLASDGALLVVSFMTEPPHETDMRRIAERTMDSLKLRPPKAGKSLAYQQGYIAGKLFMGSLVLAAAVGFLVWQLRKKRRA
jgi:hypothetical protein